MTDEQAERIATALETIVKQNEDIILRLNVMANASPQPQGPGMMTYYFGRAAPIGTTETSGSYG